MRDQHDFREFSAPPRRLAQLAGSVATILAAPLIIIGGLLLTLWATLNAFRAR